MYLSIEEARKSIEGSDMYSDAEMEKIIRTLSLFADFCYKSWIDSKRKEYDEKTKSTT